MNRFFGLLGLLAALIPLRAEEAWIPSLPVLTPTARDELGIYQQRMYKMIGSRWRLTTEQNMALLPAGEIRTRFHVDPKGTVDQVSSAPVSPRNQVLVTLSEGAVRRVVMAPFFDAMRHELPDGYWDSITFTIRGDRSGKAEPTGEAAAP